VIHGVIAKKNKKSRLYCGELAEIRPRSGRGGGVLKNLSKKEFKKRDSMN